MFQIRHFTSFKHQNTFRFLSNNLYFGTNYSRSIFIRNFSQSYTKSPPPSQPKTNSTQPTTPSAVEYANKSVPNINQTVQPAQTSVQSPNPLNQESNSSNKSTFPRKTFLWALLATLGFYAIYQEYLKFQKTNQKKQIENGEERLKLDEMNDKLNAIEAHLKDKKLNESKQTETQNITPQNSIYEALDRDLIHDSPRLTSQYINSMDDNALKHHIVVLRYEIDKRRKQQVIQFLETTNQLLQARAKEIEKALDDQRNSFESNLQILRKQIERKIQTQFENDLSKLKERSQQNLQNAILEVQDNHQQFITHQRNKIYWKHLENFMERYNHFIDEILESFDSEIDKRKKSVEGLLSEVGEYEKEFSKICLELKKNHSKHELSVLSLALIEQMKSSKPFFEQFEQLHLSSEIQNLEPFPHIPIELSKIGVPTQEQLIHRFEAVFKEARRGCFIPNLKNGAIAQILGIVFDFLSSSRPAEQNTSLITLTNAQKLVREGKLLDAVKVLEQLDGFAAFIISDWKKDVEHRLLLNQIAQEITSFVNRLNQNID